jgi:chromosome segregation ATPase
MGADDIAHLELTPPLLQFYRTRIHDLQRSRDTRIHTRLKTLEFSAKERALLEHTIAEYEEELESCQGDVEALRAALIRERKAVIELVGENAQLRRTLTHVHCLGVLIWRTCTRRVECE